MTNWDFYKDSYQFAAKAYEIYCHNNMKRKALMCSDSTMCEICQARWYTLEWKPEEYSEVMATVSDDLGVTNWSDIKFETNEESELRIKVISDNEIRRRIELANSYGFDTYEEYMESVARNR